MKLAELKERLARHQPCTVRFQLPDGTLVPAHAHVTEVARVDKRFIDCGGTLRTDSHCRLQAWVARDFLHRLNAGTLLGILTKAAPVLASEDLAVDVEYEDPTLRAVSQYPLESVEPHDGELVLRLTGRHTACLARRRWSPVALARKAWRRIVSGRGR